MNSQEYHSLQEAYMNVYQEVDEAVYGGEQKKLEAPKDTRLVVTNADKIADTPAYQNFKKGDKRYRAADHMGEETRELDEVRGGGKIDAVSDIPSIGERGSRSAKDAGMLMSPLDRATARANALKKRGNTKQANQINSRFVNPTKSAISRSLLAATNARHAEKTRLQALNNSYDLYDTILEYLISEGYADTNENALVIMANMSEEWRESIVEATIRSVTSSSGKRIYKSPEYSSDERTNIRQTAHRQRRLRQRKYASTSDARDNQRSFEHDEREEKKKRKHPTNIMNAKPGYSEYGADEGDGYHYDTVKTDSNARKRRASGR